MSDNGWPGEPGVPLNPERDGWHWIKSLTTGGLMCAEWRADRMGWNLYRSTSEHHAPNEMFSWGYLGPCLTPAEVESHKHAAVIAYANLLNLPAPPNLIAQARRDALEEAEIAAKKAGERHQEIARRIGFEPTIDGAIGHACADIRALKGEGDE
jgi:hypothetical protein